MSAPWEILGVAPNCSQSELRQAYARLLKQHRPDQDPEGFRRVRDAYEFMRANASFLAHAELAPALDPERAASTAPEPAQPPDAATPAPPLDLSATPPPAAPHTRRRKGRLKNLARKLRKARHKANRRAKERVLRKLLRIWRVKKTHGDGWDRFVARQLEHEDGAMLALLNREDALKDVNRDGGHVSALMLRKLAQRGNWPAVKGLLECLQTRLKEHPSPNLAELLAAGAKFLALIDWKRAQELSNAAYPFLPTWEREMLLADLDHAIQAGKEIASLPSDNRAVLASALAMQDDEREQPEPLELRDAMLRVSRLSRAFAAKAYLRQRFPRYQDRLKEHQPRVHVSFRNSSSSGESKGSLLIYLLPLFLLVNLSRSCNSSSSTPSRHYQPAPAYSNPEIQRINKDLQEILKRKTVREILEEGKTRQAPREDASDAEKRAYEMLKHLGTIREKSGAPPAPSKLFDPVEQSATEKTSGP